MKVYLNTSKQTYSQCVPASGCCCPLGLCLPAGPPAPPPAGWCLFPDRHYSSAWADRADPLHTLPGARLCAPRSVWGSLGPEENFTLNWDLNSNMGLPIFIICDHTIFLSRFSKLTLRSISFWEFSLKNPRLFSSSMIEFWTSLKFDKGTWMEWQMQWLKCITEFWTYCRSVILNQGASGNFHGCPNKSNKCILT